MQEVNKCWTESKEKIYFKQIDSLGILSRMNNVKLVGISESWKEGYSKHALKTAKTVKQSFEYKRSDTKWFREAKSEPTENVSTHSYHCMLQ